MPSHYDVIFLGFLRSPTTGGTPAQAIAKVFEIPEDRALSIANTVPCVVRWGVTEAVARKYHNAFVYLGAECEFRLSEGDGRPPMPSRSSPGGSDFRRSPRPSESDLGLARANAPTRPIRPVTSPNALTVGGPGVTIEENADTLIGDAAVTVLRGGQLEDSAPPPAQVLRRPRRPSASRSILPVAEPSWSRPSSASSTSIPTVTAGPATGGQTLAPGNASGVVARVREAWQRGEDAPLPELRPQEGPGASSPGMPFGEWADWEPDMVDAEFPSGVAVEIDPALQAELPPEPTSVKEATPAGGRAVPGSTAWTEEALHLRDIALSDSGIPEPSAVPDGPLFGNPLGTPAGTAVAVTARDPYRRRDTTNSRSASCSVEFDVDKPYG